MSVQLFPHAKGKTIALCEIDIEQGNEPEPH